MEQKRENNGTEEIGLVTPTPGHGREEVLPKLPPSHGLPFSKVINMTSTGTCNVHNGWLKLIEAEWRIYASAN